MEISVCAAKCCVVQAFLMKSLRAVLPVALICFLQLAAFGGGKDKEVVIVWPSDAQPVLRFSFTPMQELGSYRGQKNYTTNVTVHSIWSKKIERAEFSVYLLDANRTRVGEGYISVSNLSANETTKFALTVSTLGTPTELKLEPRNLEGSLAEFGPTRTISTTVYSVPAGAQLKLDGKDAGSTPVIIQLTVGRHDLEFDKEGFRSGHYPLVIGQNDASGGSISYELGGLSTDTVELRDGTSITGDVISVDATQVTVRMGGEMKPFARNQVKRILLVEREPAPAPLPPATQSSTPIPSH
jgi:hypothetical protein